MGRLRTRLYLRVRGAGRSPFAFARLDRHQVPARDGNGSLVLMNVVAKLYLLAVFREAPLHPPAA